MKYTTVIISGIITQIAKQTDVKARIRPFRAYRIGASN